MDSAIFELRFLKKIISTPKSYRIELYALDMYNDLCGMDVKMYEQKRDKYEWFDGRAKDGLIGRCFNDVNISLVPEDIAADAYQNVTDEQMTVLMELMNFYVVQCKTSEQFLRYCRSMCIHLLAVVMVVLLASNKQQECESWIREHLSELTSLRTDKGDSILHLAANSQHINVASFSRAPLARLLIEDGNMDVNVENIIRETPLHMVSSSYEYLQSFQNPPIDDIKRIAELLIDNGAHMDLVDMYGQEASKALSQNFVQWSFNFNLKCLAARAIVKHGIRYNDKAIRIFKRHVPTNIIRFVQYHKPGPQ